MTAENLKWLQDHPTGIIQNGKQFLQSPYRPHVYMWMNKPIYGKTFDYYMCSCGIIRSNCGFAKHKCKSGTKP